MYSSAGKKWNEKMCMYSSAGKKWNEKMKKKKNLNNNKEE